MRVVLAAAAVAALAAVAAPAGGATGECNGIQRCIPVAGPWVVVPAHGSVRYLLSCPQGRSVVGGLDALATSREVTVSFSGRIGAPVQPGVTTTRYALFHAVSTSAKRQAFQPRLGCIPVAGGGGRSTVSARVTAPGPALDLVARITVVGPGATRFGRIGCPAGEKLADTWQSLAFRTKNPPPLSEANYVRAGYVVVKGKAVVTASATDALNIDDHAVVQTGVGCLP
ncbi:MAG TPA: hypothetical protein VFA82_06895 [Gaiellaceae bacterium]|nr:hypothetical protein [Gaiellaceae bacterium]